MSKLIWSSTETIDYLLDLDPNELREVLIDDFGYDEDMVNNLEDSELENAIYDDSEMFDELDIEDFEQSIKPELEKQTSYGILIELHQDGKRGVGGRVITTDDLTTVDYDAKFEIHADDNNNLYIVEYSHDAPTGLVADLYACPNMNDLDNFIQTCMDDAIQDKLALYEDDPDYGTQEAIDDIVLDMEDDVQGMIEDYCNFSRVPEVCEPIKNTISAPAKEGLEESASVSRLDMECADVLDRYQSFGSDAFYALPYESFKKSYPQFTKSIVESYLKEDYGIDLRKENSDEINEEWQNGRLLTDNDWAEMFNRIKK